MRVIMGVLFVLGLAFPQMGYSKAIGAMKCKAGVTKCNGDKPPGKGCKCCNANSGEWQDDMWVCDSKPKCPKGEVPVQAQCPPGFTAPCYVCMVDFEDEGAEGATNSP